MSGTAAQLTQAALWSTAGYLALGAAGLAACACLVAWRRAMPRAGSRWRAPCCFLAGFAASAALAFAATGWRAHQRLDDALAAGLEGRELIVTGVISSLPQEGPQGWGFSFDIESAALDGSAIAPGAGVPHTVWLGWYLPGSAESDVGIATARPALGAGQRWRLAVKLRRPHGLANPHGFDAELWWFEQGLRALGSVREARVPPRLLQQDQCCALHRLRQRLREAIQLQVPDAHAAGVLAALSLGDQAAIARDDWDLFRRTGIAHLMSVSGLHITMFAWLAAGIVGAAWRRSARLAHWCAAPHAARMAGLLAAWAYALFAGWGVPAQRTVCMLAAATLLSLAGGRWPWGAVWAASAVAVSLLDPWALLQPGFWLSFAAVGLLLASSPGAQGDHAPATLGGWYAAGQQGVRTQAIATLGLAPLSLVFFQQISVVGFIANLVAIPLVSWIVMPLSLLGALWAPLWQAAAAITRGLEAGLQALAGPSWSAWSPPLAPAWAQAAGLLAAALLVLRLPWRLRALGLPLLLPLLWPAVPHPAYGQFDVLAADVGQGTAVIVRTARHTLVFDTGPQYGQQADAGLRVVLPLLRGLGVGRIDKLVLSHRDADHVGGAASLMQSIAPDELLSSLEPGHALLAMAATTQRCEAGQQWLWDGVRFAVLSPPASAYAADCARPLKPNALSCVVKVGSSDTSLLLTGDIEAPQEDWLLNHAAAALRSRVLVVPHHGSRTSSGSAFIAAVAPQTAIVQAGYRNRYGHPAPDVIARYEQAGVKVVETTSCGAWAWPAPGPAAPGTWADAVCERHAHAHYWQH